MKPLVAFLRPGYVPDSISSRQFIARSRVRFTFIGRGMECRVSNVALRYVGSSRGFFCVGTGALSGGFLFGNYIEKFSQFRVFVLLWLVSAQTPRHSDSQPKMVGKWLLSLLFYYHDAR